MYDQKTGGSIPGMLSDFSPNIHTEIGAHPASYPTAKWRSFPESKAAKVWG
jgi:hypothetical protein